MDTSLLVKYAICFVYLQSPPQSNMIGTIPWRRGVDLYSVIYDLYSVVLQMLDQHRALLLVGVFNSIIMITRDREKIPCKCEVRC